MTGWCLDKDDLCVATLCALRDKDKNFVGALLDADLVDIVVIVQRIPTVPPQYQNRVESALAWLSAWRTARSAAGREGLGQG